MVIITAGLSIYFGTLKQPQSQPAKEEYVIRVIGDSLAVGVGASKPEATFANQFLTQVRKIHPQATLENYAVTGATSAGVREQQLPPALQEKVHLTIIIVGANDILVRTSEASFKDSYSAVLAKASAQSDKVIALTIPRFAVTPIIPEELRMEADNESRKFNKIVVNRADPYGNIIVFDFYRFSEQALAQEGDILSPDQFHPNDEGYRQLSNAVYALWYKHARN